MLTMGMGGDHTHVWRTAAHIDRCHSFTWVYSCDCGLVREVTNERDYYYDGYSAVWMTDDDGSPMCDRCEELLNGVLPLPELEITKPAREAAAPEEGTA